MKASELRIGNSIYHDGNVIQIELRHFNDMVEYPLEARKYAPIPLKEEWLKKFGFTITNEGAGFKCLYYWIPLLADDKLYLRNYFRGGFIWGFNDSEELGQPIEIKYVHQLQNLYYALTGNELTF